MREFLQRLLHSGYIGLLEGELVRLRGENRALTNSLLGTAGFPPVDFPAQATPRVLPRVRKRSWYQLQAWREHETARAEGAAKPWPPQRNMIKEKGSAEAAP